MEAWQIQKIIKGIVSRESKIYDLVYLYGSKDRIRSILANIENTCKKHYPFAKTIRIDAETFCNETIRNVREGILHAPQHECDLFIFENIEGGNWL